MHIRLRRKDGLMRASARTEAVAVLAEGWIKHRLQYLQQRLLNQTIRYRRDAKLALASVRLGDHYPSHRLRPVRPMQQLFADRRPLDAQTLGGLVDAETVDAGCALVGPNPLPCLLHVLSGQNRGKQSRPCVLRFMTRARGLRRCPARTGLHPAPCRTAPLPRTSDAMPSASSWRIPLLLVRPFASPRDELLRPRLTSRSGSTPSPFQA